MEEVVTTTREAKNDAQITVAPIRIERNAGSKNIVGSLISVITIFIVYTVRFINSVDVGTATGYTVSAVTLFILILGASEIFIKICDGCCPSKEVLQKYGGDKKKVFKESNLSTCSWVVIILSFGLFLILHLGVGNTAYRLWALGPDFCLAALFVASLVWRTIGLIDSKSNQLRVIQSNRGIDYGMGMAYSYYYGYLASVLPSEISYNPGLRVRMEQYENAEGVSIPVKKLFILIPESGHIPPDLTEASDNWLENTKSVDSQIYDAAGVKRCKYTNTVYKIHPTDGGNYDIPLCVVTEGAKPMLIFWEILRHMHTQTDVFREHRQEIITSFYETLQVLLNNKPSCSDVCELVYYKDYDTEGKKVNVGEILLKRIRGGTASSV